MPGLEYVARQAAAEELVGGLVSELGMPAGLAERGDLVGRVAAMLSDTGTAKMEELLRAAWPASGSMAGMLLRLKVLAADRP